MESYLYCGMCWLPMHVPVSIQLFAYNRDVAMRTDSSKMTDVESVVTNFASSARTGRRNALPDIQSSAATGGTSDLPLKLEALSMKEDEKKKDEETTKDQLENPPNEEK
ncbi:cAMP-dependent protein kinase inhibitor beta isoform X2 [Marmota monax]|uniref:cAMP-dependent protein kinase inhibitor beta isoform X2 n=1 Tax=Marmota monax TaxID=9995 RepID=UPI001EB0A0AE|nr:cAMP-dependent protein kinase inhibitor beta isoform X2 [Marmota monax]XP_048652663.1 cAMP-dependent protein kinase inhibitor beta isoform X2 [Marmota marmota marmota]